MPAPGPTQPSTPPTAAPRLGVPRRGWSILTVAMLAVPLVAAALAALISKATWGYFFARPAPDARVLASREVESATFFEQIENPDGSSHFAVIGAYGGPGWYEADKALDPSEYDYYLLRRRPLRALEQRGTLDGPRPSLTTEQLPDLAALLNDVLAAEAPGFEQTLQKLRNGPPMRGVLYHLTGADGERLLLIAAECSWVSNDHDPYFEVLYEPPDGQSSAAALRAPFLLRYHRFRGGFVCYPDGLPKDPIAWGKPIECTPAAEGWYLWRYVK